MLGILLAFVLFGGLVADAETGKYYLSSGPEKLCQVMGGKYDGYAYVGGNGKEAGPKAKVAFCTAGPSTLLEPIIAPLVDKAVDGVKSVID